MWLPLVAALAGFGSCSQLGARPNSNLTYSPCPLGKLDASRLPHSGQCLTARAPTYLCPPPLQVSAFGGESLFGAFHASMLENLANFPQVKYAFAGVRGTAVLDTGQEAMPSWCSAELHACAHPGLF